MGYFTDALSKYADFTGRATRQQYWMFILFYIIFYVLCLVVDVVIGTNGIVSMLYGLGMLIPTLSVAARRLHDTDRTGGWQLISIIPLIGFLVLLFFYCSRGTGDNKYGPALQPTKAIQSM